MNNDLVTRIEQARGPDRELDEALGLEGGVASYYGDGAYAGPEYTASIDAAMSLVPEGWEGSLYWGVKGFRPEAQLENEALRRASRGEFEPLSSQAATPALALCAAALRARTSMEGQPHD